MASDTSYNLLTRRNGINIIDIAYAMAIIFFSAVCYKLFYRMSIAYHGKYPSDLTYYISLPMAENKERYRLIGWVFDLMHRSGLGRPGMIAFLAAVIGFTVIANYLYLRFFTNGTGIHRGVLQFLSIFVPFMGPIYVPGFHEYFYRWSFSIYAWHSPTEQSMVLFSILAMICFIKLYESLDTGVSVKWWLLTMLSTCLSAYSKPAFAINLILAMIMMFILDLFFDKQNTFMQKLGRRIVAGISLIPTGLYILLEMRMDFEGQGMGHSGSIIVDLDHVLNYNNLFAAVICTMAFPLIVLIANYKQLNQKRYKSVLFVFLMGFLQWFFFTEEGERAKHGNFTWGRQVGTYLVVITCVAIAVKNWKDDSFMKDHKILRMLYFAVITLLLIASIASQLYYFYNLCMGHTYSC